MKEIKNLQHKQKFCDLWTLIFSAIALGLASNYLHAYFLDKESTLTQLAGILGLLSIALAFVSGGRADSYKTEVEKLKGNFDKKSASESQTLSSFENQYTQVYKAPGATKLIDICRENRKYGFPTVCTLVDQDKSLEWASKLLLVGAGVCDIEAIPKEFVPKEGSELYDDAMSLVQCSIRNSLDFIESAK